MGRVRTRPRSAQGLWHGRDDLWTAAVPAFSGYQSQSAASASFGSAQRSPSWWCGGRPRADQQTAAAPRTGVGRGEKQDTKMVSPEERRQWLPRAQQAFSVLPVDASLCFCHSLANPSPLSLGSATHSWCPQASPHNWTLFLGSSLLSLSLNTMYLSHHHEFSVMQGCLSLSDFKALSSLFFLVPQLISPVTPQLRIFALTWKISLCDPYPAFDTPSPQPQTVPPLSFRSRRLNLPLLPTLPLLFLLTLVPRTVQLSFTSPLQEIERVFDLPVAERLTTFHLQLAVPPGPSDAAKR